MNKIEKLLLWVIYRPFILKVLFPEVYKEKKRKKKETKDRLQLDQIKCPPAISSYRPSIQSIEIAKLVGKIATQMKKGKMEK